MKRFHALLLFLGLCALMTGCANRAVTYERYQGAQSAWPTEPSGKAHVVDGIQIFELDQYPAQPYEVVGKAQVAVAFGYNTLAQEEHKLADICKSKHADAALLQKTAVTKDIGIGYEYWIIKFKPAGGNVIIPGKSGVPNPGLFT
jgi:hypothetical protein